MKTAAKRKMSGELSAGWSALSALPTRTPAELATYVTMRDVCQMRHIFDVSVKGASITVQSAPITGETQLYFQAKEETFHFKSVLTAQTMAVEMFALERNRAQALTR